MLTGPSRVKRWHLWQRVCSGPATYSALLFSTRSQPRSGCHLELQCLAAAKSPLCRGRSSPLDGAAQEMCPRLDSVENTKTGNARSTSDAPVCASLERAASAKSSPLLLAWVADNRQRSHLWANVRPPSQRPFRWLPLLWGQKLHGCHYRIRITCKACVNIRPRGASSSRRVWTASLWRRLVNRRFDLSRPALFFLSNDRFLFPNDRSFWSSDIFQRISHEFGERDRTCLRLSFHFDFNGKASWTRRLGGIRQRAHPQ